MPIERFFDEELTNSSSSGILDGEEMHHATRVFRLKKDDRCEIINGHGLLAQVAITEITKKHLSYKVNSIEIHKQRLAKNTLILGMPKFNRLELIIEKVCELGCDEIILFNADRSEKTDLSKNQMERIYFILQSSLKQCGRLFLPSLEIKSHLETCFETDKTYFFGDPCSHIRINISASDSIGVVIGPESGFSDREVAFLNTKAKAVTLSDAVLRVDTAAISAVALVHYLQSIGV